MHVSLRGRDGMEFIRKTASPHGHYAVWRRAAGHPPFPFGLCRALATRRCRDCHEVLGGVSYGACTQYAFH